MGMSASQARLLSITARLSNNEMEQQSLAYSKQRLADSSQQVNDTYLNALSKTKYHVITGYNNSVPTYADLTYSQITGASTVANGKQYLVKNKDGRVLVSDVIAKAYKDHNGDFNKMLADLGYTQSNIDVSKVSASKEAIHDAWDKYLVSVGKSIANFNDGEHILNFGFKSFSTDVFDGYPTYDTAVGRANVAIDFLGYDSNGAPQFSNQDVEVQLNEDSSGYYIQRLALQNMKDDDGNIIIFYQTEDDELNNTYHLVSKGTPDSSAVDGYAWTVSDEAKEKDNLSDMKYKESTGEYTWTQSHETSTITGTSSTLYIDQYDGSVDTDLKNRLTPTSSGQYETAFGTTFNVSNYSKALNYEGTSKAQRELYDYALSITEAFYNKGVSNSSELTYDAQMVAYYKNIFNEMSSCGYTTLRESYAQKVATAGGENRVFNDPDWMVKQLKAGNLTLSYYSISEKGFVSTGLDSDESITEREDSSAMAIAEQVYNTQMDKIEAQDKQFDLQLNKLESEHNALKTEYDAVKKVISDNVSKSFNIFNA